MAVIEIIMGERPPTGVEAHIQYAILSEDFCTTIDGKAVREPVAPLRTLFAKLKARDSLLGAVLVKLGADPDARETEAHNAVGRLLADREAVSKVADCYVGAAKKIAQGFGLSATKPDELADQVLAINTELSSALAKAQERHEVDMGAWVRLADAFSLGTSDPEKITAQLIAMDGELSSALAKAQELIKELEGQADDDAAAARQDVALLRKENARLHTLNGELSASYNTAWNEARSATTEAKDLRAKLADADLGRIMAEATAAGMRTALQFIERTLREKLRT